MTLAVAKWGIGYIRIKPRSKLSAYDLVGVDCIGKNGVFLQKQGCTFPEFLFWQNPIFQTSLTHKEKQPVHNKILCNETNNLLLLVQAPAKRWYREIKLKL